MQTALTETVGTVVDPQMLANFREVAAQNQRTVSEHLRALIAESLGAPAPLPKHRRAGVSAPDDVEGTADLLVQIVTAHGGQWTRGKATNRLSKPRRHLAEEAVALAERQGRLIVAGRSLSIPTECTP